MPTMRPGLRPLAWLLDLLSAPGRLLERSQGLRRLNLSLLAALLTMAVIGLILREAQLNGLPDVGDPFDLRPVLDPGLPADRNAFTMYRRAAARLKVDPEGGEMPAEIDMRGALSWESIPEHLRAWLEANREALDLWRQGTERAEGWTSASHAADPATGRSPASDLRTFALLALLEAARLEEAGDLAGAWRHYRGVLRSSRHALQHAGWRGREIGELLLSSAYEPVMNWVQRGPAPHLFARAIGDLIALDAMTPPVSRTVQHEYLEQLRALDADFARAPDLGTRFDWFVRNEPRRSRRVLRLLWANWLPQCDKAPVARPEPAFRDPHIFDDPDAPPTARVLDPGELRDWYEGSALADRELPDFERALDPFFERRERAGWVVEIARIWYFLDYGVPPETDTDLVGLYLKALPPGYHADDP